MKLLLKIGKVVFNQVRERGLISALLMNIAHVVGMGRGLFYKVVYARRMHSTLLAMQANSTIEIFHKQARIRFGKFVFIRKNVSIRMDFRGELRVGDHSFINDNCTINCVNRITIGKYVKIAPNVCINDHDHNYKQIAEGHLLMGEVVIGDHVWIGANVVILRNTTIGDHAVIAAGSVVKGDVPAGTLFLNKRTNEYISITSSKEAAAATEVLPADAPPTQPNPPTPPTLPAKKEILISVYDMEIGGIERSLINMLKSFDYEKYHVDLLVCSHTGEFMPLIPTQVNVLPEMGPYSVFRKPIAQCLREGHYAATAIRLLAKRAATYQARARKLTEGPGYIQMQLTSKYAGWFLPAMKKEYDLAISYAWPHDLMVKKVKAHKKIAWIHTDYSQLQINHELDLAAWSQFDYIASISDACTQSFLKMYPSLSPKLIEIENITSPAFIIKMADDDSAVKEWDESSFNIVSVGRLSYVKGFDVAVQALRKLHDRGLTNIRWFVVGYGGYEEALREQIREQQMEGKFVLLGKKTNPYPYMKACDLYVQPSRYEGKAVTVTEAQILGKPIVITNYPTARSQVEDGVDGLICDSSVDGVAAGIERLFRNHELRDSLVSNMRSKDYSNDDELKKLYRLIG